MNYTKVVIHHSACSSINGKGYDYFITKAGAVIPAAQPTEPTSLHICVEGDFSNPHYGNDPSLQEQLFIAAKFLHRILYVYGLNASDVAPHHEECPGSGFPWGKLVLSIPDGYH